MRGETKTYTETYTQTAKDTHIERETQRKTQTVRTLSDQNMLLDYIVGKSSKYDHK